MAYQPTSRTQLRRLKKRAVYDEAMVHSILDEGYVCHLGFVAETQSYVIPTIYARFESTLYFHGAMASRTLRTLSSGIDVCLTVTLIDGLVLARSAFHHSINYRSVVVLGCARLVEDLDERMLALKTITNHAVPGRWDEVRAPNELELKQTSVLALALKEVSAKVRTGPPADEEEDYQLPVWAGIIPIENCARDPIDDGRTLAGTTAPDLYRFTRFCKMAKN